MPGPVAFGAKSVKLEAELVVEHRLVGRLWGLLPRTRPFFGTVGSFS